MFVVASSIGCEFFTICISIVHVLVPGQYVFPFELKLPSNLPATSALLRSNTGASFTYSISAKLKEKAKNELRAIRPLTITCALPPLPRQDAPQHSSLNFKVACVLRLSFFWLCADLCALRSWPKKSLFWCRCRF